MESAVTGRIRPIKWKSVGSISSSLSGPTAAGALFPAAVSGDAEFIARCESMQPLYEYLRVKMMDILKEHNCSGSFIDVSSRT
jgi:hypothetical protein